jgi:hypothetical protein
VGKIVSAGIILKWILKKHELVVWTDLDYDMGQWRFFVNNVINILIP